MLVNFESIRFILTNLVLMNALRLRMGGGEATQAGQASPRPPSNSLLRPVNPTAHV